MTGEGRGDFGDVNEGDHEGIAYTDVSDEVAQREEGIVRGEVRRTRQRRRPRKHNCVVAADSVGGPPIIADPRSENTSRILIWTSICASDIFRKFFMYANPHSSLLVPKIQKKK